MRKPSRCLFLFRNEETGEVGLVRAVTLEEALSLVFQHYGPGIPIGIRRIPRSYDLFIPIWAWED